MGAPVWKVRHEGSPKFTAGLTPEQVLDGVREQMWEPSDEVQGPGDPGWRPMESHPYFAAALADYEPPPAPPKPDETKLDMNPLIDVALVLLIFFILTTTYESVRKVMELPHATPQEKDATIPKIKKSKKELEEIMVMAEIRQEGGRTVVRIDGETVEEAGLKDAIARRMASGNKRDMFLDAKDVPWGPVVAVMDAAKGAGIIKTTLKAKSAGGDKAK